MLDKKFSVVPVGLLDTPPTVDEGEQCRDFQADLHLVTVARTGDTGLADLGANVLQYGEHYVTSHRIRGWHLRGKSDAVWAGVYQIVAVILSLVVAELWLETGIQPEKTLGQPLSLTVKKTAGELWLHTDTQAGAVLVGRNKTATGPVCVASREAGSTPDGAQSGCGGGSRTSHFGG